MRKLLVPIIGGLLASVAVAGSANASTGAGEPPERGEVNIVEAREELVDCLREQGVDVPEDGTFVTNHEDEELWAALEACAEELGGPGDRHFLPFPAERMEEVREKMEGFHDCLREQGVDVPEPAELPGPPRVFEDEGEIVFDRQDGPHPRDRGGPFGELDDAELEELREAAEACGAELPDHAMPFFHHAA